MENNKIIKHEGDLWERLNNAMALTQKILVNNTPANLKENDSLPPRKYLNDFHKQSSEESQIAVNEIKKSPMSFEQMKEQAERLDEAAKHEFLEQAPAVRKIAASMKTRLRIGDIASIHRWLGRKQITLDMLPLDVLEAFKQTRNYKAYLKKN